MKIRPSLRWTKNYDLFVMTPFNRDLRILDTLVESMTKYGFDPGIPLRVVLDALGRLVITMGHHRFTVAKMLGLEVYYVISPNDIDIFWLERNSRQWNGEDFTKGRARGGDKGAQRVLEFAEEFDIPLSCATSMVGGEGAGSGNKAKDMMHGTFVVGDLGGAYEVGTMVRFFQESCGVEFANRSRFVKALDRVMSTPAYDENRMKVKAKQYYKTNQAKRGRDIHDYMLLLEDIFNYRVPRNKAVSLAFLADQAAAARQAGKNTDK